MQSDPSRCAAASQRLPSAQQSVDTALGTLAGVRQPRAAEFPDKGSGGSRAIDLLVRADDHLLVVEMKRVPPADCQRLKGQLAAYGVFLSTNDTNDSTAGEKLEVALRCIMVVTTRLQREKITERIRAAKRAQKARGEYSGQRAPFGFAYDANYNLVPDRKQQQTVRLIGKLYTEGRSPRKISADLAARGIRLSHVTIAKILKAQCAQRRQ
jgi:DNA invertase Pin-like site-specific DNA recombinase